MKGEQLKYSDIKSIKGNLKEKEEDIDLDLSKMEKKYNRIALRYEDDIDDWENRIKRAELRTREV